MYRIKILLAGGVAINSQDEWVRNPDGSIFETQNLSEAEETLTRLNAELKTQRETGDKAAARKLPYQIVTFNKQRDDVEPA